MTPSPAQRAAACRRPIHNEAGMLMVLGSCCQPGFPRLSYVRDKQKRLLSGKKIPNFTCANDATFSSKRSSHLPSPVSLKCAAGTRYWVQVSQRPRDRGPCSTSTMRDSSKRRSKRRLAFQSCKVCEDAGKGMDVKACKKQTGAAVASSPLAG